MGDGRGQALVKFAVKVIQHLFAFAHRLQGRCGAMHQSVNGVRHGCARHLTGLHRKPDQAKHLAVFPENWSCRQAHGILLDEEQKHGLLIVQSCCLWDILAHIA